MRISKQGLREFALLGYRGHYNLGCGYGGRKKGIGEDH
jgi:hypothetical protein